MQPTTAIANTMYLDPDRKETLKQLMTNFNVFMHKVKACRRDMIAGMSHFSKYCTHLDEIWV
jgi:hypothetical protein